MNSDLLLRAADFAARAHAGQLRKDADRIPFVAHPLAVGALLASAGAEEEVVAAGFLHDTVEDTPTTPEDLKREFGERVARLVQLVTHPLAPGPDTFQNRRRAYLQQIVDGKSRGAWLVATADKTHNLFSMRTAAEREGLAFWKNFRGGMAMRRDFFREFGELAAASGFENPLLAGFREELEKWEAALPAEGEGS